MKLKIGWRIRFYRKRKMLTQQELAKKMRVAQQTIAGWEKDYREPTLTDIDLLCKVLEITPNQLFYYLENLGHGVTEDGYNCVRVKIND